MARSKSSPKWLKEHFDDPFVKKAQAEGMRSRAAYKLEEVFQKDRLLKPGMCGVPWPPPGGWAKVRRKHSVIPAWAGHGHPRMPPIDGAISFRHLGAEALSRLEALLARCVDLGFPHGPHMSGVGAVDRPGLGTWHLAGIRGCALSVAEISIKRHGRRGR